MSSFDSSEPLDLDKGLPVTPQDVAAQRRQRQVMRPMSTAEFLAYLESFPAPSYEALKSRRTPRGEPFTLR
jgi:hypothetical protein